MTSQQSTTTTVVTKQVTAGGTTVVTTGTRDWSSGLFACFSDCKSLLCGLFCMPCYLGDLSRRMGEHCCVPCCVPGGPIAMRLKLRLMLGIQGSMCSDSCAFLCCGPCMACQLGREMDQAGW